MKVIKKGQIAVLSILLMVGVAGYINYKYNPTREKNLGQTMYVNGKDSFTYDKVSIYSEDKSNSEMMMQKLLLHQIIILKIQHLQYLSMTGIICILSLVKIILVL